MPKLHEREALVRAAEKVLQGALSEILSNHELTQMEYIQMCQNVLGREILTTCKYAIRVERHGNPNTPGGFAKGDEEVPSLVEETSPHA